MTHRFQLELDEDDGGFKATMFHEGKAQAIYSPKIQTPDGRQVFPLDQLFQAVRNAIGERVFRRDTFRFERVATSRGEKLEVTGFADGGEFKPLIPITEPSDTP